MYYHPPPDGAECAMVCPVEIMEQFTPAQAQSLMSDGWHCESIQWLFDKLKAKMENEPYFNPCIP